MALNHRNVVVLCTLFTVLAAWEGVQGAGSHVRLGASHSDKTRRPRADFGYGATDGPESWGTKHPNCNGTNQSPVDIVISETQYMDLPTPLQVPDFEWAKEKAKIQNDGTTVRVSPAESPAEVLQGGPLTGEYTLKELLFHWGEEGGPGSEHAIDSKYYAMEMHMLFNKKPSERSRAFRAEFGDTAILAVFLELADEENLALAPVVSQLAGIVAPGDAKDTTEAISTADLLPANRERLLVYNGSLTQPPCTEDVTWIIFEEPITVSAGQVANFRKLQAKADDENDLLTMNRRPVQARNDRVFYSTVERGVAVAVQVWPSLALFCIISVCTFN